MKGKFIVFYGINNLGKTTQAKRLVDYMNKGGIKAEYLKYPVYDLEPTGSFINKVLRGGKKQEISEEQLQLWYVLNRVQYEPVLKKKLSEGVFVVAEDYSGTGVAWGVAKGADEDWLVNLNKPLLKEDVVFLFDGERFMQAREENHLHESNDELMKKSREVHLQLAEKFGWVKINANESKDKVFENIINSLKKRGFI